MEDFFGKGLQVVDVFAPPLMFDVVLKIQVCSVQTILNSTRLRVISGKHLKITSHSHNRIRNEVTPQGLLEDMEGVLPIEFFWEILLVRDPAKRAHPIWVPWGHQSKCIDPWGSRGTILKLKSWMSC